MELAAVALRAIRETFAATAGTSAEALAAAFAAANAAVMAQNRPLATGRWERRICVGATAVALAGREIVVAQASPSQAILVQDGQVYAFPDIASWRGDYAPDTSVAESHPLGFGDEPTPRLYHSEAAPGDLIVLCATSLGRALARDEQAIVDLFGGALLTRDLEGSADRLERLLTRTTSPTHLPSWPPSPDCRAALACARACSRYVLAERRGRRRHLRQGVPRSCLRWPRPTPSSRPPQVPKDQRRCCRLSKSGLRCSKGCVTGSSIWPSYSREVASSEQPPLSRVERHWPRPER